MSAFEQMVRSSLSPTKQHHGVQQITFVRFRLGDGSISRNLFYAFAIDEPFEPRATSPSNLRYSRPTPMWHPSFPIHSPAEWTARSMGTERRRSLARVGASARGVLARLGQKRVSRNGQACSERTITPWRQWKLANNGLWDWQDGCRASEKRMRWLERTNDENLPHLVRRRCTPRHHLTCSWWIATRKNSERDPSPVTRQGLPDFCPQWSIDRLHSSFERSFLAW